MKKPFSFGWEKGDGGGYEIHNFMPWNGDIAMKTVVPPNCLTAQITALLGVSHEEFADWRLLISGPYVA